MINNRGANLLRYTLLLLLMILGGEMNSVWAEGDPDYSGTYYIGSVDYNAANTTTNFYLCPTEGWCYYQATNDFTGTDNGMPFLTTYQCLNGVYDARKAVWTIEKAPAPNDAYYYIKQALTGRYLTSNGTIRTTGNADRLRVHLEAVASEDLDDKELFTITKYSNKYLTISPKGVTGGAQDRNWLVVNGGNKNALVGESGKQNGPTGYTNTAGIIGIYTQADANAPFYLEDAPGITPVPTITNNFDGTISITGTGTIYYTTNGDEPTTSSSTYSSAITLTDGITVIKALAKDGSSYESLVTSYELPVCEDPVINFDYTTSQISIACATEESNIYYTTGGETPTASSTSYSAPFLVNSTTTVKAIAIKPGYISSAVTELAISQVATPTIQNNGSNAISITSTTPGATIYYTTDGSNPTTSSTEYTDPLTDNVSNVTIKAIAVKENMITSAVGSGSVMLTCATPDIIRDGMTFTLSCSFPTDATLYYTLGGGSETEYPGTPVAFTSDQLPMTVTAVARRSNYTQSEIASKEFLNGTGTPEDPYMIYGSADFTTFVSNVNAGTTSSACYKLEVDVSGSDVVAITTAFTGTFDGGMHTISNLGHALFNTVNGGVIKNVILDNVGINSGTNVGAIANEALGDSRIYNCGVLATGSSIEKDEDGYDYISSCSSTITGSAYVGGIVGLLDGSSRVINCFSYANVSGGTHVGGIVGYNNVATTASNLKTMVMNCMFYGEVSGGSIAPIYNGEIISNDGDNNGVNNFNYFRLESSYIKNTEIAKVYNCALGAETRFLQRFEFFRHLLRELAAWWASTSTTTVTKNEMMKWVMEPTKIGTTTPYPILKTPGKYASVVNYTPSETAYAEGHRNEGRKLTSMGNSGKLAVTIQMGSTKFSAPSGAGFKDGETGEFDLTITDKDFEHFNFNYGKVQLPYYNDYCVGNYTGNRVVTGWKIVSITGGTDGSYDTGDDVTYKDGELTKTPYNFADRNCTNKDLYGTGGSNRVFNQGAYWDVPEGVTAITIEPYWGKAVYLSDASWDVVYKNGTGNGTAAGTRYDAMTTAADVPNVGGGERYTNAVSTFNGQLIYTSMSNAIASTALFSESVTNPTVYDYAVVLVGNYHHTAAIEANKNYTVTSIDLDGDNEPDYSLMLRFNGRLAFHPVRYDFLNLIGLGMAQKTTGGTGSYNLGIMQPKAWFEVTNTALFRVTQFEYSKSRTKSPYILQGGVIEQWVTQQDNAGDGVSYFHIGGNVWFKEFHRGSHQDNAGKSTPHPPVSVTGGDFAKFYLTGYYQSQALIYDDNAECYISGGRFGEMAGAGMEGIGTSDGKGNVTWIIDHADIKEFYGGGINAAKPIHGNIHTIIKNSYVTLFCGGPKFGDMVHGRTVTTTATNCTFGTYFGAGYGGNSYNRQAPRNHNNIVNFPHNDSSAGNDASWNAWLARFYKQEYNTTYNGISTQFDYQFLPMSSNTDNVARIFVEYVGFSLATTRNVTSSLTGCTITGNFYGGGSLGKVDGDVTSTLTNCTVNGSVFGAGYSASLPTVEVMDIGFQTEPYYYTELGTYRTGVFPTPTTYRWEKGDAISIDKTNHILYTDEDLSALGTVRGKATLIIDGTTSVGESVYGGGDESSVYNSENPANALTIVTIEGNTAVSGNVFGGGNNGAIVSVVLGVG